MISNFQSQRLRRFLKASIVAMLAGIALILLLPGRTVLADGGTSVCSLTTINDPNNDCLTLTAPPVSGTITIDANDSEWPTYAPSKSLTGDSGTVRFQVITNALYLFIELTDSSMVADNLDRVILRFDPLHNHDDGQADDITFVVCRADVGTGLNHQKITGSSPSDPVCTGASTWEPSGPSASEIARSSPSNSYTWSVELKITAADLGVPDLPPILGFAIEQRDNFTPTSWANSSTPINWANLKTRYPIKYVIVLDRSGSMLSSDRWDRATKAANFMANTMSILGKPTYFEDKLGVVTFHWSCSGGDATETQVAKPLATIPVFPIGPYTTNSPAISPPMSNFCTPIGEGLKRAFETLDANIPTLVTQTQRAVLLLSDGLQNKPASTFTPASTGYDPPCPGAGGITWGTCPTVTVPVNTVALGKDETVGTALLQQITTHYGDAAHKTYFNITTDAEDLKEIFISSLEELYAMNLNSSSPLGNFVVNSGEQRVVVILSWTNPPATIPAIAALQHSPDSGSTWDAPIPCDQADTDNTVGFAICAVDTPESGMWRAVSTLYGNPTFSPAPDRQFTIVDLSLRARFGIDRKIHGTGKEMILTADLNHNGVPMTSGAGYIVEATVDIVRPDEGLGEFIATHNPDDCSLLDSPVLPRYDFDLIKRHTSTPETNPTMTSQGDDPPPLFVRAEQMLEVCNKDGLERVDEPDMILVDNGTNGDVVAGDGIYSGRIVPEHEGSHVFRFNVQGTTPTGARFTRTKLMAQYVRLEVDIEQTDMDSRIYQQDGNLVIEEFYIIPRDSFGRHLGPGYADQVQFVASEGEWEGSTTDYQNGIYARLLIYDKSRDRPQVDYIVQGKQGSNNGDKPDWRVIIALLLFILLILIIVLWFILRLKQNQGGN